MMQRTRRSGADLAVHTQRVMRFFKSPLHHRAAASPGKLLLVQGVSPRVVMEVLGHSEIALTMNAYSHVVPELQVEAANRMQAILEL